MTDSESLPEATWHYFANAAGAVDFLPDQYVYLHWHGAPMDSTELRALYVHARNLLHRHQLRCILADHRAMPAVTEADRQWLLNEWLPETVALTGYSHCAVLRAPDPARRMHTDEVVNCLRRHVTVKVFHELLVAANWLKNS